MPNPSPGLLHQARLGIQKDGLYLYRGLLPPALPHLAWVGCGAWCRQGALTPGLQAEWLAAHWAGEVALPSQQDMAADVAAQMR